MLILIRRIFRFTLLGDIEVHLVVESVKFIKQYIRSRGRLGRAYEADRSRHPV